MKLGICIDDYDLLHWDKQFVYKGRMYWIEPSISDHHFTVTSLDKTRWTDLYKNRFLEIPFQEGWVIDFLKAFL